MHGSAIHDELVSSITACKQKRHGVNMMTEKEQFTLTPRRGNGEQIAFR